MFCKKDSSQVVLVGRSTTDLANVAFPRIQREHRDPIYAVNLLSPVSRELCELVCNLL